MNFFGRVRTNFWPGIHSDIVFYTVKEWNLQDFEKFFNIDVVYFYLIVGVLKKSNLIGRSNADICNFDISGNLKLTIEY